MKQKFGLHSLYRKVLICLPDFISIYASGSGAIAETSTSVNTGTKPASGDAAVNTGTGSILFKWNVPVSYANGTDLIMSELECVVLSRVPSENYLETTVNKEPSLTSSSNASLLQGENILSATAKLMNGLVSVCSNEVTRTL